MAPFLELAFGFTDSVAALIAPSSVFPAAAQHLRPTALVGSLFLAIGLATLGCFSVYAPEASSEGYGMSAGKDNGWIAVAGLRDISIAASTLGLLRRTPEALVSFLPGVLLIPLGDVAIASFYGDGLLTAMPHVYGVIAITILIIAVLTPPPNRSCKAQ